MASKHLTGGSSQRSSNLELLRIIAMVMITFNHINLYYRFVSGPSAGSALNQAITVFYLLGGKFGCNVFMILSCWFLTGSEVKVSRFFKIILQTFFYLFFLNLLTSVLGLGEISAGTWLSGIRSVLLGRTYWYSFTYVIVLLFYPVLRTFMDAITHKKLFLALSGFLLCLLPTLTLNLEAFRIPALSSLFDKVNSRYVLLSFFIFCFVYWYRTLPEDRQLGRKGGMRLFIAGYLLMFAVSCGFYFSGVPLLRENYQTIRDMNSLPCLVSAFGLFCFLLRSEQRSCPAVNRIAGMMFGAFLLQVHPDFRALWANASFVPDAFAASPLRYLAVSCLFVLFIFLLTFLVESLRLPLEKRLFGSKGMKKLEENCGSVLEWLYSRADFVIRRIIG